MDERERKGWFVVLGGLLVNLMFGVTYAWSVFSGPLADKYGWSQTEIQLAYSIMLAVNAFVMIPAGRFVDRHGPRAVALAGGLILGAGFVATGIFASSTWMLYVTYGIIVGVGVGIGYISTVSTVVKWFEGRRGLATGIVVFGFGFGSLILAPVATWIISFRGVSEAFIILGVVFAVLVSLSSRLLKNPPQVGNYGAPKGISATELLGKTQFWLLWLMFLFSTSAGLMVIGILATFAKLSFVSVYGMDKAGAANLAALAVGVLAVFNGAGRVFAGMLSDGIGRRNTFIAVFVLQAILIFSFVPASSLFVSFLFVWVAAIGFCFGANFSLFPSAAADFFGTDSMGSDYGLLFTAFGLGGILGPQVMAFMLDSAKAARGSIGVLDYSAPFMILAALVLFSAVLAFFVKNPSRKTTVAKW